MLNSQLTLPRTADLASTLYLELAFLIFFTFLAAAKQEKQLGSTNHTHPIKRLVTFQSSSGTEPCEPTTSAVSLDLVRRNLDHAPYMGVWSRTQTHPFMWRSTRFISPLTSSYCLSPLPSLAKQCCRPFQPHSRTVTPFHSTLPVPNLHSTFPRSNTPMSMSQFHTTVCVFVVEDEVAPVSPEVGEGERGQTAGSESLLSELGGSLRRDARVAESVGERMKVVVP